MRLSRLSGFRTANAAAVSRKSACKCSDPSCTVVGSSYRDRGWLLLRRSEWLTDLKPSGAPP